MAHVTLIRPPFVQPMDMINQTEGTPSLGLAYLLGSLKDHGHEVSAVDAFGEDVNRLATITNIDAKGILINGIGAEKIVSMIPKHTDVIGITCMFSNEWLYARYIINQIKLNFPRVPIIAGGEHITSESYRSMLYTPALTACALGEGEEIINDLVDALVAGKNLAEVQGIAYFDENGNYRKTERRLRIKEVDDIPLPSWEEIPIENYLAAGLGNGTLERRAMPMLASRGCPYTCTFCSSPSMWGIRWVSRNPRLVVDEIKFYIQRYNINHIDFNDLTTVINRAWIIEFCQLLISENLGITWSLSSGTRSEALDHEVLGYMKRAGIQRITYAPESGSNATLERVKKKVNLEKMTGSIRSSVKVGIYSRANFIFGLPDQTKFEAFESVAFATKLCFLGMYDIACMCFAPYPGSELFERLIREGGIKTDHGYDEFLINNLTTKVTGMKSWSKYIPSWSMPLWTIGTTIYFYSLQFILRPHRLFQLCYRLIKRNPTTMFETIVYGLFVSFFRRKKLVVKEVEPIEAISLPLDKEVPNKVSDDPLILINSGNPARGLI
jgi:anaerobic magnesium-protoporphyrin IX monomethyl ester cyclase